MLRWTLTASVNVRMKACRLGSKRKCLGYPLTHTCGRLHKRREKKLCCVFFFLFQSRNLANDTSREIATDQLKGTHTGYLVPGQPGAVGRVERQRQAGRPVGADGWKAVAFRALS